MTISQLDFDGNNKVEASIALIQLWQPKDEPYYLGFSGGKDSLVLKALADEAGANYIPVYHPSPLDPPEIMRFIKQYHPDVKIERPPVPFWKAFEKKGFPQRMKRWCCEYIKEWGGSDKVCLLGIRADESKGRSKRCFVETKAKKTRFSKAPRVIISPMLKWTDSDIWEYIHSKKLPYVSLYDEGYKRLGCVMCPLANDKQRLLEYQRFPKIAYAWYRGFQRLYESKHEKYESRWVNADELFWWWMGYKECPPGIEYPPKVPHFE